MTVLVFNAFTRRLVVAMVLAAVGTLLMWKVIPAVLSLFLGTLMASVCMFFIQFIPAVIFFYFLLKARQDQSAGKAAKDV